MFEENEEEYFLPLQDQQIFGAGIRRKRVPFVRAESEPLPPPQPVPKPGLGDRYLAIVLPQSSENEEKAAQEQSKAVCEICKLPITPAITTANGGTRPHESSLAHQVCLAHSHPPSHLDRDHAGLKYLASYGWDPDARRGLGATQTGIRVPIKSKIKNDTIGLGVREMRVAKEVKVKVRLNAKQAREQEALGKKRRCS